MILTLKRNPCARTREHRFTSPQLLTAGTVPTTSNQSLEPVAHRNAAGMKMNPEQPKKPVLMILRGTACFNSWNVLGMSTLASSPSAASGWQRYASSDLSTCTPTIGFRPNGRLSRTRTFTGGMYSSSFGSICVRHVVCFHKCA